MKINLNLNTLLLVCAIVLATFFCYKWLYVKQDKTIIDKQLEELIKAHAKELHAKKIELRKDSMMHEARIDSARAVFEALEAKRKADNRQYQNKLNALKKVNSYSSRTRYADSLARAIGY